MKAEHISTRMLQDLVLLIRQRRIELGLSQRDLSILAFGTPNNKAWVSNIENGVRTNLTVKMLFKVLYTLKINIHYQNEF